jgi:hypothetical protein
VIVASERAESLLSRGAREWRRVVDGVARKRSLALSALIAYAHERLCELRDQAVDPWAPDRWTVARLQIGGDHALQHARLHRDLSRLVARALEALGASPPRRSVVPV